MYRYCTAHICKSYKRTVLEKTLPVCMLDVFPPIVTGLPESNYRQRALREGEKKIYKNIYKTPTMTVCVQEKN